MAPSPEYRPVGPLRRLADTRLGRIARRLVPEENATGVIYGMLVISALLAAESGEHDGYLDTFASAAIATGLYWLGHSYAELLGGRLASHERLTAEALRRALARDWPIVRGAGVPLAALAIAWAAGAARETGVTVALCSGIAGLIAFELLAGVRARASGGELALDAGVGAALGIAIIALKIVLH